MHSIGAVNAQRITLSLQNEPTLIENMGTNEKGISIALLQMGDQKQHRQLIFMLCILAACLLK
jgi:hypothetical protein